MLTKSTSITFMHLKSIVYLFWENYFGDTNMLMTPLALHRFLSNQMFPRIRMSRPRNQLLMAVMYPKNFPRRPIATATMSTKDRKLLLSSEFTGSLGDCDLCLSVTWHNMLDMVFWYSQKLSSEPGIMWAQPSWSLKFFAVVNTSVTPSIPKRCSAPAVK